MGKESALCAAFFPRARLKTSAWAWAPGFGVPPSGGFGAGPPKGGTPNQIFKTRSKRFLDHLSHRRSLPGVCGSAPRSTKLRAERGRLKSCKDDERIAQAQRGTSAGLGKRHKMIPSLFSNLVWRARARQTRLEKREIGYGVAFTQGGGLGGLALGYYLAAPPGAPEAT